MKNKYILVLFSYYKTVFIFFAMLLLFVLGGVTNFKTNYNMRYWLDHNDHLIQKLNYFEDNFGNDESAVISLTKEDGILEIKTLKLIREMINEIELIEDVKSTISLINLEIPTFSTKTNELISKRIINLDDFKKFEILDDIKSTKLIQELFISRNLQTLVIYIQLKPTIIINGDIAEEIHYRNLTKSLRDLKHKYEQNGLQIHLTGTPILQNDFSEVSEIDLARILPILFLFIMIVLYFLMNSFAHLFTAMFIIMITNISIYGFAGYLDYSFENMLAIVPLIVLTISLADIIHLFMSFKKKINEGHSNREAIEMSLASNLLPTFLTSLTTSIGFITLYTSKLVPVSHMGVLAAIGVMLAWVLSISIYPIFLLKLSSKKLTKNKILKKSDFLSLYGFVVKFKRPILIISLCLSLIMGLIGAQNEINTDPLKYFKESSEVRTASEFILKEVGAITGPEIIIHSGMREGILELDFLNRVDSFGNWLKGQKYIDKSISMIELGKELYKKINKNDENFYKLPETRDEIIDLYIEHQSKLGNGFNLNNRVSNDMESMRLTLLWKITDAKERLERLEIIKLKAKELGLDIYVTGKNALFLEMNQYVAETFFSSIIFAIGSVFLIMLVLLKSLRLAFISMLPNLVPLGFIIGLMQLAGITIDIGTALVCAVCLGIAIDDTIHFMINYGRYREDESIEKSILKVFRNHGHSLIMTSFILIIGFGLFLLSEFIPNIKFGFLCSLTILMAIITDLYVLPSAILSFDKSDENRDIKK